MDSILRQMFGDKVDNPMIKMFIGLLSDQLLADNKSLIRPSTYNTNLSLNANLQNSINRRLYSNTFGELEDAQTARHTKDLLHNLYTKGFGYSAEEATNALNSEGMRFVNWAVGSKISGDVSSALSDVYGTAFNRRYVGGASGLTNVAKYANVYRGIGEKMLEEHYINKAFGSLDVGDVGSIYSALIRTGKYDQVGGSITDTTSESEVEKIAKTRAQKIASDAKQYSKALSTLKDTLGGSIKDIIGNVEALFQTSMGSISPQQLQNMANNIAHSTNITGVGVNQIAAMSSGVYQRIQPYGGDAMMANQIAINSSYSMINDPRTYGLSKDRYNAAVLNAHTNKMLNGSVQYMSAAYQAWADKRGVSATDASSYEAFLKDLKDNNVQMTSAGMTEYMRSLGRSSSDIAALVQSDYTSRLSAQFNMSGVMFTQQNNKLNRSRAAYLNKQIGGDFVNSVLGGVDALSEMTDDDVRDAVFNHLTTRENDPLSREQARIVADRMGKYMRVSARAALGNTMGEKESLEFMRNQAAAEKASKTQLWSTGVLQAFRGVDVESAKGLEGIKQLLMSGDKRDIGISSILSVGLLGVDIDKAADHLNKIGGLQGAEREKYINDNILTDENIAKQYRTIFGKDPGRLTKEEQIKAVRNRLITESEEHSDVLNAKRTAKSTITQKDFQMMQAKAVTTLARLRNNPKDKEALKELGAYINNKDGVEVSESLKYAYNNGMIEDLFTEKGKEKIQTAVHIDKTLDTVMNRDMYKNLTDKQKTSLRAEYKQAATALSTLSKEDRARLSEAMHDGKLTSKEVKSIEGLERADGKVLRNLVNQKDPEVSKDIFNDLMSMSANDKNTHNMWDSLFSLIRDLIDAVKDI